MISQLFQRSVSSGSKRLLIPHQRVFNFTKQSPIRFQVRSLFIQTEHTPNENALKFVPGKPVLSSDDADTTTVEFVNPRESLVSPLGKRLFQIEGIKHVMLGSDFITVTKDEEANWAVLKPDIYSSVTEFYSSNEPAIEDASASPRDTSILDSDTEDVKLIKELIETRIRPSIQMDGGDIEYLGFDDGIVKLKLRGACRTCASSVVTLKHGIENMLMHYVPAVMSIEQVEDEEEAISMEEFRKLEDKLNA